MGKLFLLMMAMLLLSACSATTTLSASQPISLPAAPSATTLPELVRADQQDCLLAGGLPSQARQLDGSFSHVCAMSNGKRCNAAALQAGNCG